MKSEKCIAIFGGSSLQLPLIIHCKALNLRTLVLDPDENALAREYADFFESVSGDDFDGTCELIQKYGVQGIISTSTDKPLEMMARIAKKFQFPFISIETASQCTDKYKMKQVFQKNNICCATGKLISEIDEIVEYPIVLKPLDNSGSRGVFYCDKKEDAEKFLEETKSFSGTNEILCEEFVKGDEYSVESIHTENSYQVIQITEKLTSPLPYRVEMGHIAPSNLSAEIKKKIEICIRDISSAFNYKHCIAHTEIKIFNERITVIETSPRPGGDFITSSLVPLSTGLNIEESIIKLSLGQKFNAEVKEKGVAGIFYLSLEKGLITQIDNLQGIKEIQGVVDFQFDLKKGDIVKTITNSLNRYGYLILIKNSRSELMKLKERVFSMIKEQLIRVNHA